MAKWYIPVQVFPAPNPYTKSGLGDCKYCNFKIAPPFPGEPEKNWKENVQDFCPSVLLQTAQLGQTDVHTYKGTLQKVMFF